MGTWQRTSLIFSDLDRLERVLDHIANANGMERFSMTLSMMTPEVRSSILYSDYRSADIWMFAVRVKHDRVCVVKTLPLGLMAESVLPVRSRPLVSAISAYAQGFGLYHGTEDSCELLIVSDESGTCHISGTMFEEGEEICNWEVEKENEPHLNPELRSRLEQCGIALNYPSEIDKTILREFAELSEEEISDEVVHGLLNSEYIETINDERVISASPGWSVLAYRRRGA